MKRALPDAVAIGALVALQIALYRKVLWLWWILDDSQLLHTILQYSVRDEFFNRAVWPQQLFTPFMYTAFEAEWARFGFDPSRWYVVDLILVCIATAVLYAAVRMFLGVVPSFAAAAIFIAGTPLCSLIAIVSGVHYFLAILLGSLSVIAFVLAIRRESAWWAALSALFYFGALLSKEIAAPLPLVLAFLPRARIRFLSGHALALILYFAWRRAVIGAFLGGYGFVTEANEWPVLLWHLPWKVIRVFSGPKLVIGVALLALIVAAIVWRARTLLLLASLAAAFGPVLPVMKMMEPRHVLMVWLVLSVALAAALRKQPALLAAALVLVIVVNRQEWAREFRYRLQLSNEGRAFMDLPPDAILRRPLTPPPNMRELAWLKTNVLHRPAGAMSIHDDFFFCTNELGPRRVWQYDAASRWIVDVTPQIPEIARRWCSSIRTAPLSASFHHRGQVLRWELGPYEDGKYSVLIADGIEAWELQRRRDALNLPDLQKLSLRVRYDSPEGWTTYSPVIDLDFMKQPDMTWRR